MRTVQDTSPGGLILQNLGNVKNMEDLKNLINPADLLDQLRGNLARHFPEMAAEAGMPIPEKKPVPLDSDIEPFELVELLLTKYVEAHQAELWADMDNYGDVRQEPGYDPEERQKELEGMRVAERDQEQQREDLAHHAETGRADRAPPCQETNAGAGGGGRRAARVPQVLSPMEPPNRRGAYSRAGAWLPHAEAFQKQHAALFRPQPTTNKALLKRLADLGDYEMDTDAYFTSLSWSEPKGFDCDWCSFSLRLAYPPKQPEKLPSLLAACERLRRRFGKAQEELREAVLERFATYHSHGYDDDEDYELDEDGNPTEESILKTAASGSINFTAYDGAEGFEIDVCFNVDWDPEHNAETNLQDEPEEDSAATAPPANVEFGDSGPKLSPEDLNAFEKKHKLKLPTDYREFLLMHNGGRPMPNHFPIKIQGAEDPSDVECLFAIGKGTSVRPEDDLTEAIARHRQHDLPAHMLPIGRLRRPSPFGEERTNDLVLGLSGKQEGKLFLVIDPLWHMAGTVLPTRAAADKAAIMKVMYERFCVVICPNITTFLSRLTVRPAKSDPEWLVAIKANDAARFVNWLQGGGKLQDKFRQPGDFHQLTVLDYLARLAPKELLKALIDRSLLKATQLLASWQRFGKGIERFHQLRPLLTKEQLRFAFASPEVWDDAELLANLLSAGIDMDGAIDEEGATPLHAAIHAGRADGVRWLLAHGASPSKADGYGRTGLMWAESDRQLECLKLLVEAGESIEKLFPHMRSMSEKLMLLQNRWMSQYPELAAYLHSRGIGG